MPIRELFGQRKAEVYNAHAKESLESRDGRNLNADRNDYVH